MCFKQRMNPAYQKFLNKSGVATVGNVNVANPSGRNQTQPLPPGVTGMQTYNPSTATAPSQYLPYFTFIPRSSSTGPARSGGANAPVNGLGPTRSSLNL